MGTHRRWTSAKDGAGAAEEAGLAETEIVTRDVGWPAEAGVNGASDSDIRRVRREASRVTSQRPGAGLAHEARRASKHAAGGCGVARPVPKPLIAQYLPGGSGIWIWI